ncbi:MAG TPA: hypothetical protein VD884_12460 [Ohtaekwangia sp.]|nr:hypothetical protein [Ohtaekwangia sp.]
MRFLLAFYFITCSYQLFGQYDYFDFEGYDAYKSVYASFIEEQVNGKVKELKKYSISSIPLHVELDRNNQIIKKYEYADTLHLVRTVKYADRKIVRKTEYHNGIPTDKIHYTYNKSGNLTSMNFFTNKELTTKIEYQYDNAGRIAFRKQNNKKEFTQFVYEGDSVIWKLIFNERSILTGVLKKNIKKNAELIVSDVIDTTSDVHFMQRIKPTREYLKKWDNNENILESAEFDYDISGKKILRCIIINEFDSGKLTKSVSKYNTDLLKGEYINEFSYNHQGRLESEVSRHGTAFNEVRFEYDDHGNCTARGKFVYRFLYDKNGNWILKQRFNKQNSSTTEIIGGVTKTKKYAKDSWTTEARREIKYFD